MLLQAAYILHSYKYKETSLLVKLFTKEHGLIAAVAKGGLLGKNQAILQPFQPLSMTLSGKRSLYNLYKPELEKYYSPIPGRSLLAGLYANELLIRFCVEHDPHPTSYLAYCDLLNDLRLGTTDISSCLRTFEWLVFADTGYALDCSKDADNKPIESDSIYMLDNQWKLRVSPAGKYKGSDMISISQRLFHQCPKTAKMLSREIISRIIGSRGMQSWSMFR